MAKIGKRTSAKKYAHIRILQAQANKMLYKSTHIEKSHGKRKQVLAMKRQFYKSRGIKNPSRLSFRDLSPKDIKAYEKLLKSIVENTYINPEKYKQYQQKMRDKFESYGYNFEFEEIQGVLDDDFVKSMLDELDMSPSDFWQVYNDIKGEDANVNEQDFIEMLIDFRNEVDTGGITVDDFYVYADAWLNQRADRNDGILYT